MKAITRKEAEKICRKLGLSVTDGDGKTYYMTNDDESEVWEFDTKAKRDKAISC